MDIYESDDYIFLLFVVDYAVMRFHVYKKSTGEFVGYYTYSSLSQTEFGALANMPQYTRTTDSNSNLVSPIHHRQVEGFNQYLSTTANGVSTGSTIKQHSHIEHYDWTIRLALRQYGCNAVHFMDGGPYFYINVLYKKNKTKTTCCLEALCDPDNYVLI